jgi:hypothetical protein
MSTVLLIGNGLSTGFDERLSGDAITVRVNEALGGDLRELLGRIAELAQPERADEPIGAERGDFEQLAGPLDRLAEALLAIQPTAVHNELLSALHVQQNAAESRTHTTHMQPSARLEDRPVFERRRVTSGNAANEEKGAATEAIGCSG